jgi:hypothetical protein
MSTTSTQSPHKGPLGPNALTPACSLSPSPSIFPSPTCSTHMCLCAVSCLLSLDQPLSHILSFNLCSLITFSVSYSSTCTIKTQFSYPVRCYVLPPWLYFCLKHSSPTDASHFPWVVLSDSSARR